MINSAVIKTPILATLCMAVALASIHIRRAGWLDRVVQYQKNRFIEDLMKAPPPQITVRIERPPPGYVDSKDWDYDSVIRLLTLIRDSEGAAPVRRAFRRAMKTRRYITMPFAETFKVFPSLSKNHPNDFFYDIDSSEYFGDVVVPVRPMTYPISDDDVIVVSNPVEAKLPSAKISVKLLKTIMEDRAKAGRVMPTSDLPISWPVTEKRTTTSTVATEIEISTTQPAIITDATVTSSEIPQTNVTTGTGNITTSNSTSGNATTT